MKNINLNKNNLFIAILIIVIIIFLVIINKNEKESNTKENYVTINNPSNFFTIENCINKFINTLYTKDTDNILLLLNDDYINNHGINKNNLFNYISEINQKTSFKAKKIYKYNNSYYVYGYLTEETIDSLNIQDDYYIIIHIDDNNIFDITPYDGSIFKGENNG